MYPTRLSLMYEVTCLIERPIPCTLMLEVVEMVAFLGHLPGKSQSSLGHLHDCHVSRSISHATSHPLLPPPSLASFQAILLCHQGWIGGRPFSFCASQKAIIVLTSPQFVVHMLAVLYQVSDLACSLIRPRLLMLIRKSRPYH